MCRKNTMMKNTLLFLALVIQFFASETLNLHERLPRSSGYGDNNGYATGSIAIQKGQGHHFNAKDESEDGLQNHYQGHEETSGRNDGSATGYVRSSSAGSSSTTGGGFHGSQPSPSASIKPTQSSGTYGKL